MKKSLIITIGVILILLVLGVWMYLFVFGTPKDSDDIFTNLGFDNSPISTTPVVTDPTNIENKPTLIDTEDALRQLTTRPVAGFGFVGTSSTLIHYAERGTGHIYKIVTDTGEETRISGTTIPQVVGAVFSERGTSVALISENDIDRKIFAGKIPNDGSNVDFLTLPNGAFDPYVIDDNTVQYAIRTDIGTDGYRIDIRDETSVRIFSIPISDIEIAWGSKTYVYNKPSELVPGALYEVNTFLSPVTPQSFGFVGGVNDSYYFGSANQDGEMTTYTIDKISQEKIPLAIDFIPEKCAFVSSNDNKLWCASPFTQPTSDFLEKWHKGILLSEDVLWNVEIESGSASLEVNFFAKSGRYIDVDHMVSSYDGTVPLFRNKIDGTLWLYDSTVE